MSLLENIPFPQLEGAVRAAASANPDKTVSTCSFFLMDDDQACPSCIIGQAFYDLGYGPDDLPRYLSSKLPNYFTTNESGLGAAPFKLFEVYSTEEALWVLYAQAAQDRGKTWAEAVDIADQLRAGTYEGTEFGAVSEYYS